MPFSQESPINIHDAVYCELGDRELQIHWDGPVFGTVKKDEHGVKVEIQHVPSHFVILDRKKFHLIGFHFHHPAEHWIEGSLNSMELHVVHQNIDDGAIAVVGIMLDVAKKNSAANAPEKVVKFIAGIAKVLKAAAATEGKVSTSPKVFLPPNPKEYYRYEGSLTTTPYSETVSWVVMRNPLLLKKDELIELIVEFKKEARFLQPINRRFILKTFKK